MDTLGRAGVRDAAPVARQEDEDCVEASPAKGGGVQRLAALCYPARYVADNLSAPALCSKYQLLED